MSHTTMAGQAAPFHRRGSARSFRVIDRRGKPIGFLVGVQEATIRWDDVTEPIAEVGANGAVRAGDRVVVKKSNLDSAVNVDVP